MKRFAKDSRDGSPERWDDQSEILVVAAGLILLLAAITLGAWLVDDRYVGTQAGAVLFIGGWCAFALYSASADGAAQGRLLPPLNSWLKFAAPVVAASGSLWLASGRWD